MPAGAGRCESAHARHPSCSASRCSASPRSASRLRADRSLAYLLISHNLAVVEQLCEQVAVLYLGQVVEWAPAQMLMRRPAHPYTQALRRAVPELGTRSPDPVRVGTGDPPDPLNPPPGCRFHPRCPLAVDRCRAEPPVLRELADGRSVACHRAEEALAQTG